MSLILQQDRMIAESKPEAAGLEGAIEIVKDKRDQAIQDFLNHVQEAHEASPR